jgi:cell division transport system ATP-binding protein
MVFITGHSGAGKSTLLKLSAGIERPNAGTVVVSGHDLAKLRPGAAAVLRRNIGLVFQDHKLLFDRTVHQNVALPLQIDGYNRDDAARRVRAALNKVGLLEHESHYPVALSGGEQQRLCIARAIVNRPGIVIADEPTAHLDSVYATTILDMLRSFNQVGVTILIAMHDSSVIGRYKPRVLCLDHGRLKPA